MNGTITLKTRRLVLRKHRMEDAQPLHEEFGCDEKMFEFSGWNPYGTEEQAAEAVQRFLDGYAEDHFYGWAIDHEGELAGTIGAYDYDAEADSIEIGCSIARRFWGKGFASEAVKAVLDYLLEEEKIDRVTAWCAADNIGSMRVMEKAGMRQESREEGALEIGGKRYDKLNYVGRREMVKYTEEEIVRAFHMMWDSYPEQVRLIDRKFRVVAGNPAYIAGGGQTEVKCNVGDPELHRKCQAIAALDSGETKIVTNEIAGMEFEAYWVPVAGSTEYHVHFNNGLNEIIAKLAGKE